MKKTLYPDDLKAAMKLIDYLNKSHTGEMARKSVLWNHSSRIQIENPEHGQPIGWAVVEDTFWMFEPLAGDA